MKFADIILLLNTDDYWITIDGNIETTVHIEGSSRETMKELGKYIRFEVERITPVNHGIEIDLISK